MLQLGDKLHPNFLNNLVVGNDILLRFIISMAECIIIASFRNFFTRFGSRLYPNENTIAIEHSFVILICEVGNSLKSYSIYVITRR